MGLAYPLLVYFGIKVLPPGVIVIGLLALIVLQSAIITESSAQRPLLAVSAGAALVVVAIAVSAPLISLKAYPILFSLGLATLFGYSLLRPPTVIERIARLREPDLDEAVSPYLRKVTMAWLCFFVVNAGISAGTAIWGSLEAWTLYNGLISYLLIGSIFTGEFAVRYFVLHGFRATE
jgi:uncharacterized membrane protein